MTGLLFGIIALLIIVCVLQCVTMVQLRKDGKSRPWVQVLEAFEKIQDKGHRTVREEFGLNREESLKQAQQQREELRASLNSFSNAFSSTMTDIATLQKNQLDSFSRQFTDLTNMNEKKLETMRNAIDEKLKSLQDDNNRKLEQMRETVDEKLHTTLEKRLGESFNVVSDRLEKVHQGLGEMQTLASGVGDLKKVLTNVKTRGTWGEIQLGNLLEQILTADQYETNVVTKKGSRDPVEFAIKLPRDQGVYIPIDSKFPKEDYERLLAAQEAGDMALVEEAGKALEKQIKTEAKKIRDKYLDPPHTTDFAIMYLSIEGLYAEVLRRPGLSDVLQREYRVTVSGPTTIAAVLNSLQMGFRTLAVEKRASEVWTLLGRVKTEFGKFGKILEQTKQKLDQASKNIDTAAKKTGTIERSLKNVQALPGEASPELLETDGNTVHVITDGEESVV